MILARNIAFFENPSFSTNRENYLGLELRTTKLWILVSLHQDITLLITFVSDLFVKYEH